MSQREKGKSDNEGENDDGPAPVPDYLIDMPQKKEQGLGDSRQEAIVDNPFEPKIETCHQFPIFRPDVELVSLFRRSLEPHREELLFPTLLDEWIHSKHYPSRPTGREDQRREVMVFEPGPESGSWLAE